MGYKERIHLASATHSSLMGFLLTIIFMFCWKSRICFLQHRWYVLKVNLYWHGFFDAYNIVLNIDSIVKIFTSWIRIKHTACVCTHVYYILNYGWLLCIKMSWRPSDAIWRQRYGSTLAQVMACCLTAPSHYLNHFWLIISKVLWHLSDGNFISDTSATIH